MTKGRLEDVVYVLIKTFCAIGRKERGGKGRGEEGGGKVEVVESTVKTQSGDHFVRSKQSHGCVQ